MIEAMLSVLLIVAVLALSADDLLGTTVLLAVFSLLCALVFYYLHAPDVAITEAAVGAGVSTLILVWAVKRTTRKGNP